LHDRKRHMSIAVEEVLAFLADDILARAEVLKPLSPELAARITALTADVPVSLPDEIEGVATLCKGETRR
jgi:antitoxin PrlF